MPIHKRAMIPLLALALMAAGAACGSESESAPEGQALPEATQEPGEQPGMPLDTAATPPQP